ncbi:GTP cyclohydrolase 1-like [Vigna unguiculata]|uniref:GTP cyclohydrolase 1-like n=1 Tax=Vigna unguiculata TaxID=3917 RepID=UPI001016DF63|nr:GTP cyclohydrolase 1-like [Vigna unguiculata]
MGHLGQNGLISELENGVTLCCDEECCEKETVTTSIQYAVKVLLMGLGEDINREGIRKTPLRVAKALSEGTRGYVQSVKEIVEGALFPEAGIENNKVGDAGGVGGVVIVRDLEFYSYCESCMLPFYFTCHVGYVPSAQRVLGLSKLSRVTNVFAKRLQEPQRLANEVCSALHEGIQPTGVAVVLQCKHIPFPDMESYSLGSNHKGVMGILVSSGSGVFENKDANLWADFFGLLQFRGIDKDKIHDKGSMDDQCWCPSLSSKVSSKNEELNPAMLTAVASILKSLGEDPTRKQLQGTPARYTKWLMNFKCSSIERALNCSLGIRTNGILNTNGGLGFHEKLHSELNMPFLSQCEHHLLPFHGVVHIGYFISKGFHPIEKTFLQSIVHFYGFKLQVQERLTKQIAETISPLIGGNVIVVVEASHTCMISRGIEKFGSNTATIATLGCFCTDLGARTSFLESIPNDTYISCR